MIKEEFMIKKYIDQIPHEYYRTVIRVLVLEGASREEFALEMGKKVTAINNDVSRAMSSLMQVALPDIRWRTLYIKMISHKMIGLFWINSI